MMNGARARSAPEIDAEPVASAPAALLAVKQRAAHGPSGLPTRARTPARVIVLLAVLAALVYGNALTCGFAFDDQPVIRDNPAVTGPMDPIAILVSPWLETAYRPFTVWSFALNEAATPGNARAFHAVNIVLHATVTVLVFWLARRLVDTEAVALVAAILFAVHPIHTEAVTNIVGRAELLAALGGLIALLSAARLDTATSRRARIGLQVVSLTAFSLAQLSKESALSILVLIPLFRIACRRERWTVGLWTELRSLDWLPYALCAAVCLMLRAAALGAMTIDTVTALDNVLAFVPWSVRVRSAVGVLWDYFGLLNVPLVLGADYSYAQVPLIRSWLDARFLAGLALVGAGVVALVRDRRPAVTFAVALLFASLALTTNVFFPIGTVKGERLLYFPSVGWAILVAYAGDCWARQPRQRLLVVSVLAVAAALFAARTWTRNWDWVDNAALYRSMVRSAPNSAKSRYDLGFALQQEESDAAAIVQFKRALEIYPYGGGAGSPLGIGIIYDKHGLPDKAIEWYEKALAIEPGFDKAHTNLCRALLEEDRFSAAARACRRGLRYKPSDANLLKGLGESLVGTGEVDKGLAVLRRSLALNPGDHELRTRVERLESAAREADEREAMRQ